MSAAAGFLQTHREALEAFSSLSRTVGARADYVQGGGGLVMVGGYLTFQGIDGRASYAGTLVEEALPAKR